MAITLKTPEQIELARRAGRVVGRVLDHLGDMAAVGVCTRELDAAAEQMCTEMGAQCLFKGVPGRGGAGPFPKSVCVSINEQVVHGIPSDRRIEEGDIVSLDFGVKLDGWCGDAAETFVVGDADEDVRRLVEVTRNSLAMAVQMVRQGGLWSTIARALQD